MMTTIFSFQHSEFVLALLLGLWILLPAINPYSRHWRVILFWSLLLIQIMYIKWRYTDTIEQFEFILPVVWQYIFFTTESIVVLYVCWQCLTLPFQIKREESTNAPYDAKTSSTTKTVDLFIPTYSEPESILIETIRAAKSDYYPNLTIWICDDSNRAWLRRLCESEQVKYLNRPTAQTLRTKAANLNWSIEHGDADYIVCLDADFQARPEMSTRLTEQLSNASIGLVQAPQHFRNLDPIQSRLGGGKAWTEEQRFFFDISLPSRDAWNNTLCVGSCWAARRSVLNELNGFPTDSIVEDVYFGYCVKRIGWKTTYLNETLATGLAAVDAPSYICQRSRWCMGAIALLRAPHGPIRSAGLGLIDRIFFFEISYYWLTQIHLLLLLLAPALYGFFGLLVFRCTTEELMTIVIPKNIFSAAVFYWISQGRCIPLITQVQKTLPVFSVVSAIFKGLIFPNNTTFKVTTKKVSYSHRTIHWRIALPFLTLALLNILSVSLTHQQNFNKFDWSDYTAFNTMLSAYSILVLFLCCLVCIENPDRSDLLNDDIPEQGSIKLSFLAIFKRIFC